MMKKIYDQCVEAIESLQKISAELAAGALVDMHARANIMEDGMDDEQVKLMCLEIACKIHGVGDPTCGLSNSDIVIAEANKLFNWVRSES